MDKIFAEHKGFWTKENKKSLYQSFLLIVLAFIIQISAGHYSSRVATSSNFVGDVFLDNLPVINLDFVVVFGALLFWMFAFTFMAFRPKYLLFGLKAVALFIVFRAFFISLTHIGIYPHQIFIGPDDAGFRLYKLFTFQGNFFFSGHAGFPFLMALIFWREKKWRWFFLSVTFIFAASVLLAHVHYSIDVFAAPFITYGIFKAAEKLFQRDYSISQT